MKYCTSQERLEPDPEMKSPYSIVSETAEVREVSCIFPIAQEQGSCSMIRC